LIEILLISALRTTLIVATTGLTLSVFRVRSAAFRHACWTLVLIAMISMPFLTFVLPPVELPLLPPESVQPTGSVSVQFGTAHPLAPSKSFDPVVLAYGLVALALLGRWWWVMSWGSAWSPRQRLRRSIRHLCDREPVVSNPSASMCR
jgi:hypothetical protein